MRVEGEVGADHMSDSLHLGNVHVLARAGEFPMKNCAHRGCGCGPAGQEVSLLATGFQGRLMLKIGHKVEGGLIPHHSHMEAV